MTSPKEFQNLEAEGGQIEAEGFARETFVLTDEEHQQDGDVEDEEPPTKTVDTAELLRIAATSEQRIPVLTKEHVHKLFGREERRALTKEWVALTGLVQKKIKHKPIAEILLRHIHDSLSENLPLTIIQELCEADDEIRKQYDASPKVELLFSIPEVPDDKITKDGKPASLRDADKLQTPKELLRKYRKNKEYFDNPAPGRSDRSGLTEEDSVAFLQEVSSGRLGVGISPEERDLIQRRYTMARDMKFLMLASELENMKSVTFDTGEELSTNEHPARAALRKLFRKDQPLKKLDHDQMRVATLESGVEIGFCDSDPELIRNMLSPDTWKFKKWIKDRIHMAKLGDTEKESRQLVIKERKTSRHRDTLPDNSANTSRAEVEIANTLFNFGEREDADIHSVWERPLGYIKFPDKDSNVGDQSFQCAIFERQPDLVERHDEVVDALTARLEKEPDWVEDQRTKLLEDMDAAIKNPELAALVDAYRQLILDTKMYESLPFPDYEIKRAIPSIITGMTMGDAKKLLQEIDCADLARVIAPQMVAKGAEMGRASLRELGYEDKDHSDHAFRIPKNGEIKLEVLCFDTEYVQKRTEADTERELTEDEKDRLKSMACFIPGFRALGGLKYPHEHKGRSSGWESKRVKIIKEIKERIALWVFLGFRDRTLKIEEITSLLK